MTKYDEHFSQKEKELAGRIDNTPEAKRLQKLFINQNAKDLIKKDNYIEIILNELSKKIVEEKDTSLTIFLIACGGCLTLNAAATSKNLMVNDDSGAGKDYIVNSVLSILPKLWVVKRKRISVKTFTYWKNSKFDPEWTWDGKIFYNEDISNSVLNCDVFKVMSSSDGDNLSTIIINNRAIDILTKGKPVMLITIASATPKKETLRRYPICNINTSEAQTKLILKRKAEFHEKGIVPEYSPEIRASLKMLERVKVKVPYASKLVNLLCTKHIIIRTHFDRFIDYIKFSAAVYQHQRKRDSEGFLLANEQDYELARQVLIKTTSNIFSVPLTKRQQKILEIIKVKKKVTGQNAFSVSDLEPDVTFTSDRTLRTELDNLAEIGFLKKDNEKREESKKPVMVYVPLELYKINIPSWKNIENLSNNSINTNDSNVSNVSNDRDILGLSRLNETNEKEIHATKTEKEVIHHKCSKCDLSISHGWTIDGKPICELCMENIKEENVK